MRNSPTMSASGATTVNTLTEANGSPTSAVARIHQTHAQKSAAGVLRVTSTMPMVRMADIVAAQAAEVK